MNGKIKNKLVVCILVLMVVSVGYVFALDVTVQQGNMTIDNNLTVEVDAEIGADLIVNDELRVGNPVTYDPVLYVYPNYGSRSYVYVGTNSYPANLAVDGDFYTEGTIGIFESYFPAYTVYVDNYDTYMQTYGGDFYITGNIHCSGKINATGGCDPPYVLYDPQSRQEVIDRVQKEVPPDKQSGASLFFNKENKRLETYVASDGKFYDLEGNLIHELAQIVEPTKKYETVYHFDMQTGKVVSTLKAIEESFQIKEGYELDKNTGNFINSNTKQVASREEALEIFAAHEGKVYDLEHNLIRNIEDKPSSDFAVAGNNSSDIQINKAQNNSENQNTIIKPASFNK